MLVVELICAYECNKFATVKMQVKKLQVEGDSATVVRWLKEFKGPSQKTNELPANIMNWVTSLEPWKISHIYREGNALTDWIADVRKRGEKHWYNAEQLPIELVELLNRDQQGFIYTKE